MFTFIKKIITSAFSRLKLPSVGSFSTKILAPMGAIIAVIAWLYSKLTQTQVKLGEAQAENKIADILAKKDESTNEANKSESDYDAIRDQYLKQHSDGGDTNKKS